jgi:hypothetical protein
MIDNELSILKDWRFVPIIRYPDPKSWKGPRTPGWQKKHYTLEQIPDDNNIGVILGVASNGILAVDFDGPWTWEYWIEHIKIPFESIDTVTWTSNKVGRCQMAFRVPKEAWSIMPAKFAKSGPVGDDGKPQQLEFRWGTDDSGCQSVLPPSLHPDGIDDPNIYYNWLRKPSEVEVQEIPAELLEWIINNHTEVIEDDPIDEKEYRKNTPDEVVKLAEELKRLYPTLYYDTWIRVTWAFCHELGISDGIAVMKYHYPETKRGEYAKLAKSRYTGKKVTIGTIVKMIKDRSGVVKKKQYYEQSFEARFNRN